MGSVGKSNSNITGLPKKTVLKNKDDYKGYAWQLASVVEGDEVYQINYNGGKAFADAYVNNDGHVHIDFIGSTGKGAGSELLARLAEKAVKENRPLSWNADQKSAVRYYSHMGIEPTEKGRDYNYYEVPAKQLPALIKRLRKRKSK